MPPFVVASPFKEASKQVGTTNLVGYSWRNTPHSEGTVTMSNIETFYWLVGIATGIPVGIAARSFIQTRRDRTQVEAFWFACDEPDCPDCVT